MIDKTYIAVIVIILILIICYYKWNNKVKKPKEDDNLPIKDKFNTTEDKTEETNPTDDDEIYKEIKLLINKINN